MKPTQRDFFWLLLVVAICCAWWLDHRDGANAKKMILDLDRAGMSMESLELNHILDKR